MRAKTNITKRGDLSFISCILLEDTAKESKNFAKQGLGLNWFCFFQFVFQNSLFETKNEGTNDS